MRVTDSSASDCAGCAIQSLCHPKGKTESVTEITVATQSYPANLTPGMKVEIGLPAASRYRALITALGIPCLLLLAVAVGLPATGTSQAIAALAAIAVVFVYYSALYLLRHTINQRFRWQIIGVV
ncbi:MAG: SoxR reducing system RseC family protein [Muribaculum sp.]|nr:SoxR reducing system RseC family protein [Muribaculaceae bacterium]MCM1080523.1 SoxR reducing system RseC family protein [Muribaculum sp.]